MTLKVLCLWPKLLAILGLQLMLMPVALAGDSPISVWQGVYTPEQAQRGEQVYRAECQSCHANDMRGGPAARGLLGLEFRYLWQGRSLAELLQAVREKMPPGNAGSLADQAYADVIAAILQRNGFPAGGAEIPVAAAALTGIVLNWEQP
jgi:mono/diheme cytochrome c family protein